MKEALDFTSPAAVLRWLAALRSCAGDIAAAGRDATLPPRDRVLSRAEARRQIDEGEQAIKRLIEVGYAGMGETMPLSDCLVLSGEGEGPGSPPPSSQRRPR
jgi:hypothetical protein